RRRLRAGRGTLNPLIGVRIPAPEQGLTSERPAVGHKVGHKAGGTPDDACDEACRPTPPPSAGSLRADMGRALADALARALATGDARAARVALTALSGLVDDAPEGSRAPVVDLASERERRGR